MAARDDFESDYKLVVIAGAEPGQEFALDGDEALIGRDPSAQVALGSEPAAKARHLLLNKSAAGWEARDLGGTLLNGQKLSSGPFKLAEGDELKIGSTVLRFMNAEGTLLADRKETLAMIARELAHAP